MRSDATTPCGVRISDTRYEEDRGRLHPSGSLGARYRRHLCQSRARAGDDLPGDAPGELRARRDGDVLDLHRLEPHQRRHGLLARLPAHRAVRARARRGDRAGGDPARRERAGACDRGHFYRAACDPQQRDRLDLQLHHQDLSEPVPQGAFVRQYLHLLPRARRNRRHPGGTGAALRLLPLHPAGTRNARRGAEPGIEPAGRHSRGLDARARLGARGRRRRGGRHDDRAHRIPRSEHDGRHPALRVRRGAARRHRQPRRRGDRRFRGRRARERPRRLRDRQRPQALGGAGAHHRRAVGEALGLLRQGARDPRMTRRASIAVTVLLGLNILTGYNGQISLGHGAFYAIGAYTAAVLMDRLGAPYWATIPAAGAVCLVAGFLFGLPALRLEGLYLALATFALGVSMPQLLKYHHLEKWTGGVQGIVIAKPEPPAFLREAGLQISPDQWLYFFALAVAAMMFVLGWNLLRGRVGRALIAIRDQHVAAEAMGINSALYKSLAFGVSAMYTGIAGALGAIAVQYVAPDSFTIFLSLVFLVGIVVGGLASISDALYGALFIQFVPNVADEISKAAPWAIFGLFLIAFVYLMPAGVAGAVRMLLVRRVQKGAK